MMGRACVLYSQQYYTMIANMIPILHDADRRPYFLCAHAMCTQVSLTIQRSTGTADCTGTRLLLTVLDCRVLAGAGAAAS